MIQYHPELIQGSDEWLAARCGLLTASEMKLIITPTLRTAANDKSRGHIYELLAQRITKYVEPHYISDDMLRGQEDEIEARIAYSKNYAPVEDMGFITNDRWGFTIGCSPDGLVGDDGMIECKSRRQKWQIETITNSTMPDDYWIQVQTELLVTERKWCDFISYSSGLPMVTLRIYPATLVQEAIVNAAAAFEKSLAQKFDAYRRALSVLRVVPTERRMEMEIVA